MADLNVALVVRAVDRASGPLKRIRAQTDRINESTRRAAIGFGALDFAFTRTFLDTASTFERFGTVLETVEGSSLHFSPRGETKYVRGPSGRGASRLARAGVLEQYVEHGKQAQRSPGGRMACFGRRVVRNAG